MKQASNSQEEDYAGRLSGFWAEFHVFPLRIERWGLKYWYLLILLPYALVFVLIVITGYLDTSLEVAKKEGFVKLVGATTRTRVWAHIREEFLLDIVFNSTGLGLLLAGS